MSQRGHNRERAVRRLLELDGWWTSRAAGSLGDADIVALKVGESPRLIEVKSNTAGGPYANFRRTDRYRLAHAAIVAGAEAWLCYWPPYSDPTWIAAASWPQTKEAA